MANTPEAEVSIGKFDILATYTFAQALAQGVSEPEAKQRGMVAAIMGAQARLGVRPKQADEKDEFEAQKEAAETKKKTSITADSFDRQVSHKMGDYFHRVFLPVMQQLVAADLSYNEVKRILRIPGTWGAKISGSAFEASAAAYLESRKSNKRG
jgi:hypothetical protein